MYLSRHPIKVDDNVCIVNGNLNFNNVLTMFVIISFVIISLFNSFFQIFFNVTVRIVVKKVGIADINDLMNKPILRSSAY